MQKAPDYERIRQMLGLRPDPLNGDEELWLKRYLELGDKLLTTRQPVTMKIPS